jgi:hypothetical protein
MMALENLTDVAAAEPAQEGVDLSALLQDFQQWIASRETERNIQLKHIEADDVWEVSLGADYPTVLAYLSEIDKDFYGEAVGLFLEVQMGTPKPNFDYPKALEFCSQEMVLGRLTLRREPGLEPLLLVEAGCPFGEIEFELLELMVLELAAIALDLREEMKTQLA